VTSRFHQQTVCASLFHQGAHRCTVAKPEDNTHHSNTHSQLISNHFPRTSAPSGHRFFSRSVHLQIPMTDQTCHNVLKNCAGLRILKIIQLCRCPIHRSLSSSRSVSHFVCEGKTTVTLLCQKQVKMHRYLEVLPPLLP